MNESFSHISFSYSLDGIRVIRGVCARFETFFSTVLYAHTHTHTHTHRLNINEYMTEALLCWPRSVMAKCDFKNIYLNYENIAWISLRIRDQVSVQRSLFLLVPQDISFVPYPHGTIFFYFSEVSYTFDSITPFNSDLIQKLIQGVSYETSCSHFNSFYDHAIPFLFTTLLRFSYFWFYTRGFAPSGFHMVLIILPR